MKIKQRIGLAFCGAMLVCCAKVFMNYETLFAQDKKRPTIPIARSQQQERLLPIDQRQNDVQRQRIRLIAKACQQNKTKFENKYSKLDLQKYLFYDDVHNLVYCGIQKAGSSFMWQLLMKLGQSQTNELPNTFHSVYDIGGYNTADMYEMLSQSYKFMFVREPYERLYSGYIDKLFSNNMVYWGFGKDTILPVLNKIFHENIPISCGQDVSFRDFVRFVIVAETVYTEVTTYARDSHFTPMYDHCKPCQINYDFIGKMETMDTDVRYLINSWNSQFGTKLDFNDIDNKRKIDRIRDQVFLFFQHLDKMKTCMPTYTALKREWRTLQVVGVIPIEIDIPFLEQEAKNVSFSRYFDTVVLLYDRHKDTKDLHRQRHEAMVEAYRTVPISDLLKLKEVLDPDCELFGYDPTPAFVFNRSDQNPRQLYFAQNS